MSRDFPWNELGIAPTDDRKAIRSAYAARLKAIDPDEDIAGFSALREARDEALWLASQGNLAPGDGVDPGMDAFSIGAPIVSGADGGISVEAGGNRSDNSVDPEFSVDFGARSTDRDAARQPRGAQWEDADGSEEQMLDVDVGDPLATAQADGAGDVDSRPLGYNLPFPQQEGDAFLEILAPGGQYLEDPLTAEEYERGSALMQSMIATARASAIDQQGGIEDWLAHFLASTWPRSSPLVTDAMEAFGWDRDAGRLDEHAPVAFLNDRLRALAFLDELAQPGHHWHKAYEELRKPGPKSPFFWQRANRTDVTNLLVAIRTDYPELEQYLDGERIESYAEPNDLNNPGGWVVLILIFVFFMARIAGALSDGSPSYADTIDRSPPPISVAPAGLSVDEKQAVLDELLGPGVSYGALASEAPDLYSFLTDAPASVPQELAIDMGRGQLRRGALLAAAHAPFEELVAIQTHRLALLRSLRSSNGAEACGELEVWVSQPNVFGSDTAIVAAERDLFRRLLDAGLLRENDAAFPRSASIPGPVVQAVMDRMGISEERFALLAGGGGNPAEKCTYRIAMLEEILRRPGSVSADLLRIS